MNILGHSYVATCAVAGNRDLLIIGSLLPESFPFISGNPLTGREIHEGGKDLLKFLDSNYPKKKDLALGVLAHSMEFGADKFNKDIERYTGAKQNKLLKRIALCSGVKPEIASYRLHNFLWWGVDYWIQKTWPKFVREIASSLTKVDIREVSKLIAEAFEKNWYKTEATFKELLSNIYRPEDLSTLKGLAATWARQAAGLPEKDVIDVPKATEVFKECAEIMKGDWRTYLDHVVSETKQNLKPFLYL